MKNLWVLCFLMGVNLYTFGQQLSGTVIDEETKKGVAFASISIVELELFTTSNEEGKFVFTKEIPTGLTLRIAAIGYETQLLKIEGYTFDIQLKTSHIEMEEVTVSAQKNGLENKATFALEVKKITELQQFSPTNLGDALTSIAGVYNSSTGNGISKPVIRGFQGIRIVSLLNGIRLENQQWGGDHGMGLTDLGIGTVEVIKGPASLFYGADALGGIIYYKDESYVKQNSTDLTLKTRFESNTMGTSNSLGWRIAKNKIRFNVYGGYNDHADYRLPNGKFAGNSRFKDYSGKFSLGVHQKNWVMHVRYAYNFTRTGIPGHSHDSLPDFASFQVKKQTRELTVPAQVFQNHILSVDQKLFFKRHQLSLIIGQTLNSLTEYEEKLTIPGIQMNLWNTLYTLKDHWNLSEKWTLTYGLQGMYQQTRNLDNATEQLLPNTNTLDQGVFANLMYDYKKWTINFGARYDLRSITTKEVFNAIAPINKFYQGFNYAAGFNRRFKNTVLKLNLASGFRIPHVSELLADGVHHGSFRYEIGNLNLKPEKANQLDFSYEYSLDHIAFSVNPFVSYIRDFVYLEKQDTTIQNYDVYNYQQKNEVWMYGADFGIHFHPHFAHWLHYETNFSYLQLENRGEHLPFIPQPRWSNVLKFAWESKKKVHFEHISLQLNYFLPQNTVANRETPSVDYALLNFSSGIKFDFKAPLIFNFGVRNILNTRYIDHLSRLKAIDLSGSGINVFVGLQWQLTNDLKN